MSALTSPRERVVGRYVLCDEIAAGGMATVHLGRLMGPVGFARIVAIKRLHAHFAKDPEFVAMLLDEARLAARIQHPNVISTLDVVVEKGEMLVVMDYVQGESLARLARTVFSKNEQMPLGVVMSIMAGTLYGLHAAHEATNDQGQPLGIVHRDVSPQNVLVGIDGVARVLDFGVAKAVGRAQTTREGTLKGKLAYMSPEQIRGDQVDRRSDVYAAAVVLWELLCGRRLFQADNEGAVIHRIMSGAITPPSHIRPDLPPSVDALVMKGLAMRPDDRWRSAWEMAEAAQHVAFATPGDVGAWVRFNCGDTLEERAARIAEIESDATRVQPGGPSLPEPETQTYAPRGPRLSSHVIATLAEEARAAPAAPGDKVHSQVTDFSAATPFKKKRGGPVFVAAMAALLVVAIGAGIGVGVVLMSGRGPNASASSTAGTTATVTSGAPSTTAAGTTIAGPTTAVTTAATSANTTATATATASSARPVVIPPKGATAHTTVSPPRAKCNPPYTIDANGIRVPKPECL